MKLFLAGIITETNTFCPIPTGLEDFIVQRGVDSNDGRVQYPALDLSLVWGRHATARGYSFVFGLMAFAQPGGITVRSAYETLRDEILEGLRAAMPVDVVLLHLHGAMIAVGYESCEEDIIRKAREIVGSNATIGVELDLHCHLFQSLIDVADIIVTYKEYPHVDIDDRAREVFDLSVATRLGDIKPTMALFDCRMIGLYPTSREPMRRFVDSIVERERAGDGILSISFGHGFQFSDGPNVGAKALVIADDDLKLASDVARNIGRLAYDIRREIGFDSISLPMETALLKAMAGLEGPVVIADQSDNVGAGAPGDATFALRWLLENSASDVAIAFVYDPEVVRIAKRGGNGAILSMRLGGKLGVSSGDPIDLHVTVLRTLNSYMHGVVEEGAASWLFPAGDVAALRSGTIDVVVCSERCQCLSPAIFSDLGIDVRQKRILIVKSTQHFYSAFAPIAQEIIYMSAPGAVCPDPRLIPYRRLDKKDIYPWVDDPLSTKKLTS